MVVLFICLYNCNNRNCVAILTHNESQGFQGNLIKVEQIIMNTDWVHVQQQTCWPCSWLRIPALQHNLQHIFFCLYVNWNDNYSSLIKPFPVLVVKILTPIESDSSIGELKIQKKRLLLSDVTHFNFYRFSSTTGLPFFYYPVRIIVPH